VVFLLYWLAGGTSLARRNLILLAASYVFYGWWDWRFLSLLAFSTVVDYAVGRSLDRTEEPSRRKALLATSLVVNLGLLGFFKYFNFFAAEFASAFTFLGMPITAARLDIILPVGISFYTFQTLSYSIDVYRRQLVPSRDLVAFSAYVSFFPQLVAGPIERATNLLPQFAVLQRFDRAKAADGLRQMLWGLFKKLVIADNCALEVDRIFGQHETMGGSTLLLGAVLFAFQIYGDFSGYSDIAIGCARLFGFSLMRNFAFPYFSRDMAEFWRRWHISLSTWFRDYLYIPLGGSKGGRWMAVRNTFIIFLVSGFWHGANWTFMAWGALNALYFLPLLLRGSNRTHIEIVAAGRWLPKPGDALRIGSTFLLTCIAWVFFRSANLGQAFEYLRGMLSPSLFRSPEFEYAPLPWLIGFFVLLEWIGREHQFALERLGLRWPWPIRWGFYALLIAVIGIYMAVGEVPFIYFQF
jgi:D-alanyl-lipoteichoic acid acyltransferase DltB (MBOAT superfamily)